MLGAERRNFILDLLKTSKEPLTGSELAKQTNVSRQVIVGDITLLKAMNEPIVATSQGYIYTKNEPTAYVERIVACYHTPQRTEEELQLIVDYGVTVKDVTIDHPVYGDLKASVMVSNRRDVELFMEKMRKHKASFLLELTEGYHLHTLSAPNMQQLDEAEKALGKAGFLVETLY
ncbi:transcription repressor NadR [Bacillus litorisediminis]|uniref:transcription repressor NadR n=1 Tax=Bacillus litorisediminis TaxID=2922713 RepID=UPI001FAC64C8|nr:transcription repressor NadR [Bacillus litorisediminis]